MMEEKVDGDDVRQRRWGRRRIQQVIEVTHPPSSFVIVELETMTRS